MRRISDRTFFLSQQSDKCSCSSNLPPYGSKFSTLWKLHCRDIDSCIPCTEVLGQLLPQCLAFCIFSNSQVSRCKIGIGKSSRVDRIGKMKMEGEMLESVLWRSHEIQARVAELGRAISVDFDGRPVVILGVIILTQTIFFGILAARFSGFQGFSSFFWILCFFLHFWVVCRRTNNSWGNYTLRSFQMMFL